MKQLVELPHARDLSSDELSSIYCDKYGVSISQALKIFEDTVKQAQVSQNAVPGEFGM